MKQALLVGLLLVLAAPAEARILHLTREGQSLEILPQPAREQGLFVPTRRLSSSPAQNRAALFPLLKRISSEERIPLRLLESIVHVESGFYPWALNVKGKSYVFADPKTAQAFLKAALHQGITLIDIGYGQINWQWHGHHFKNPSDLLIPECNLRYGAKLLRLHALKTGSWMKAALLYHSADPTRQQRYHRKILAYLTKGKPA